MQRTYRVLLKVQKFAADLNLSTPQNSHLCKIFILSLNNFLIEVLVKIECCSSSVAQGTEFPDRVLLKVQRCSRYSVAQGTEFPDRVLLKVQ